MVEFSRSLDALNIEARFGGGLVTVFCEARSETDKGIMSGDERFIRKVFDELGLPVNVECCANKRSALRKFERMKQIGVKNILAFVDRDYDHLFDGLLADPRILYTYGYSWENDLVHAHSGASIVGSVFYPSNPVLTNQEYAHWIGSLEVAHRRFSELDIGYWKVGGELFARGSPNSILGKCVTNHWPLIDLAKLKRKRLGRKAHRSFAEAYLRDWTRLIFGKTVLSLHWSWVQFQAKKAGVKSGNSLTAFVSPRFGMDILKDGSELRNYYSKMVKYALRRIELT